MKKITGLMAIMLLALTLSAVVPAAAKTQYISVTDLKNMLGDPQVLIIDVRAPIRWAESDKMIPGAVRYNEDELDTWGPTLPRDKKIVLY